MTKHRYKSYFCEVSRMRRSMLWLCFFCVLSRYLSFISASQDSSSFSWFSVSTVSVTAGPSDQEPHIHWNAEFKVFTQGVTHWTCCWGLGAFAAAKTWWGCKSGWKWWKAAEQRGGCGTPWWVRIFGISIFGRCSLELLQTWSCAANTQRESKESGCSASGAARGDVKDGKHSLEDSNEQV